MNELEEQKLIEEKATVKVAFTLKQIRLMGQALSHMYNVDQQRLGEQLLSFYKAEMDKRTRRMVDDLLKGVYGND